MRNANCLRCPLHAYAQPHSICMAGTGLGINGIMLVGEAPGQTENEQGRPFIGRAGQLLDRALKDAGIAREECYTSNAVKCWPGEGNPTPLPSELDACLPYLLEEIEEYQPRVIICLGNAAMMALTGKDKITRERGRVLPPRKGLRITAPIMATFHPSYALRNPSAYQEIVSDLRALTPHSPDRATSYIVTPDTQEPPGVIAEAIEDYLDCKLITVDLEWSTGNKKKNGETAMAWPWTPNAEAFSVSIAGRINGTIKSIALGLPLHELPREALARLLSAVPGVYHNAMADLIWLLGMGFQPRYGADTMILAYLIDETQARTLAAVATKYGGLPPEWKRDAQRLYHTRDEINWPELLSYNLDDVRATLLAFEGLREHINASPRRSQILGVHNRILSPVIPILANAAVVGVPIDTELLLAEGQACTKRRNAAIESLSASTGLLPAQAAKLAASSKQIQEYVNGALGLNIENAEAETLMPYRAYPAIKGILKIKKESKFSQTYFEPWRTLTSRQEDGRLHTIYRPVGTVTGRLSAELEMGGSIHVAPRNEARSVREKYDRDPIQFRRLIKAAPGRVIVAVDASQVELRTIAWLAPEPTMRRLYNDDPNADLHLRTAIEINRKKAMEAAGNRPYHEAVEYLMREGKDALGERLPEWKDYRQDSKAVNFGFGFGMREEKFVTYARTNYEVEFTLQEAQEARAAYMRLYSGLEPWHARSMQSAQRLGYGETPFGRRRKFTEDDLLASINYPVQSAANDLTAISMGQVSLDGLDAVIIGTIHDSILVDSSERDADEVKRRLVWSMERPNLTHWGITLPIPLVADASVSQVWK